jgi:hypothetical protein
MLAAVAAGQRFGDFLRMLKFLAEAKQGDVTAKFGEWEKSTR